MEAIHDIVSAKPLDGYKVDVEFDTGDQAVFDCSRYLDKPYWRRLKDKAFFNQGVRGVRHARVAGRDRHRTRGRVGVRRTLQLTI